MSRGRFELLYSVFNECSEELIVKSNFMFFFLYCVVFLFGFGCFFIIVFLSERQIYAFMFAVFVSGSGFDGFYSLLARVGFTVLPGWGRLLLSFCRVRGSGVRRRSSAVSWNGACGCLMVIQDVSRFSFR